MIELFFKKLPPFITASAAISLLIVVLKVVWWNKIPAVFPYAYELGLIVEPLLLSYLASYIFYLVVVHYREVKEQYDSYPYVLRTVKQVVSICRVELSHFSSTSGIELKFGSVDLECLGRAFEKIDPHEKNAPIHYAVPYGTQAGDWVDYLKSNADRIANTISKLVDSRANIDSELLALVLSVEQSGYIKFVRNLQKTNMPGHLPGSPFQKDGDMYFGYYQECLKLSNYIERIEKSKI
ncbi:hypothetical protein [Vibrio alginolyticus]|uniref:hypothetical protein n=1 Tax=Vibrio alginolyticus TaxID=663 RepID=UPI0023AF75CE|nr:hypothetical protein [Vibrio alginolyticus]WED60733.1 hypothetical protein O6P42_06390 [Vibrio alginolyticus]